MNKLKPMKSEIKEERFEVVDSFLNFNEMQVGPAFFDGLMEARDEFYEKKVTDFIIKYDIFIWQIIQGLKVARKVL